MASTGKIWEAIQTAVETLDNAISGNEMQVDVVAALPAGTNTIGATQDAGDAFTPDRKLISSADISAAAVDATDAPTAGQKRVIVDIFASVDTAMRLDFKEETSGTVILSGYLAANSWVQLTPRGKLKLPTADKKLQVQSSAAGNVRIVTLSRSEA